MEKQVLKYGSKLLANQYVHFVHNIMKKHSKSRSIAWVGKELNV